MQQEKLRKLKELLDEMGPVLIAYSGGVDSTFLLKVARDVLEDRVLAVTARSPTYPEREYLESKERALKLGVKFLSISTDELSRQEFIRNYPDRCYWCKRELFAKLWEIARQENIRWVAEGSNFNDLKDFRPGRKAAEDMGVRSPLCEVELTKEEIRLLSRKLGLSTWDKASFACLASRIPYGTSITREVLEKINIAEESLLSLGLCQVRVRHHGEIARIEVEPADMEEIMRLKKEVVGKLKDLGYVYIALDLEGYRSGSLNKMLKKTKGRIVAVCQSDKKGVKKEMGDFGALRVDYGLIGDAHADPQTHRQVSLLSVESISKMQSLGVNVGYGDFAENITTEGIDLVYLPIGARLLVGDEVILEVTQIGKECHTGCAIFRQIGKCIMPKEGIFARVIRGGLIRAGDTIKAIIKGGNGECLYSSQENSG